MTAALALTGIIALAVRQILHGRRTLADLLNLDGDPAPRSCSSSWCPLDHSDSGLCDAGLITGAGLIAVCDLADSHTGHHRDTDVRWSRNFGRAA